jgi:hypothetical protein
MGRRLGRISGAFGLVMASAAGATALAQPAVQMSPGASQAFRPTPDGKAQHIQSGMLCVRGSPQFRLAGLVAFPDAPVGDDVACDYATTAGKTTLYATRVKGRSLEQLAPTVIGSLRSVFPDARPTDPAPTMRKPGLSASVAGSYLVTFNGKLSVSSTWLAKEGDWLLKVRATYPADARKEPELLGATLLLTAQQSVHDAASAAP